MIQSFFVYIIFGLTLFVLGNFSLMDERIHLNKNKVPSFWVWHVFLAFLVFAFVSGVRWNVGVDHKAYLKNYLTIQRGGESIFDKEYGFEFVTNLFAENGIHFSFYFGFLAALQLFFIYRTFKNERFLYPFIGIVVIFGPEYLSWMNGTRQMLVATVFVWSIQFIYKRQLLKYAIIIGLASLFHKSAIMLLIFYFIPQKDYFKNRIITISLVGLTLVLGEMSFWIDTLKNASGLLVYVGYDHYSENIDFFVDEVQVRNFGPRRLTILLISIFTIWYSSKLKIRFNNFYFLTYFNLAIGGILLHNLLGNMHHVFVRPLTYLIIFSIATTAYLLVYLKENFYKHSLSFIFVLILSLSYLPLSLVADSGKGKKDYSNYKFYWYHVDK